MLRAPYACRAVAALSAIVAFHYDYSRHATPSTVAFRFAALFPTLPACRLLPMIDCHAIRFHDNDSPPRYAAERRFSMIFCRGMRVRLYEQTKSG